MSKQIEMPLFDNSLHVYEFQQHKYLKEKYGKMCEDVANSNMNTNDEHHFLVYQSPTGLQVNHAFKDLIEGPEINQFCSEKIYNCQPAENKMFAVTNMWITIIPPGGMISYHTHKCLFHGMYFLHAVEKSGNLVFHSGLSKSWFETIGNPIANMYNSAVNTVNTTEGHIYLIPGHINHSTTANDSQDARVSINFTLDLIEK